jgi:FkbM family methyltransferase
MKIGKFFHRYSLLYELKLILFAQTNIRQLCKQVSWFLYGLFLKTVQVTTPQGKFCLSTKDASIGRELWCYGSFEVDIMERAAKLIRSNSLGRQPRTMGTILDIGANIGVTSISMINSGFASRAIAVEPEPRNFELLTKNVELNGLESKVLCRNCALSDRKGQINLELSVINWGDHRVRSAQVYSLSGAFDELNRKVISVPALTLDDLVSEIGDECVGSIGLAWIDVQGYEGRVIKGGSKIFYLGIPTVIELWPYGIMRSGLTMDNFFNIIKLFWTHFYDLQGQWSIRREISVLNEWWENKMEPGVYANYLLVNSAKKI